MKVLRFILSIAIAAGLVITLDNPLTVAGQNIPPIGRFLDPFNGFWQNAESRTPDLPSELSSEGVTAPVKIAIDSTMIPHIFASNDLDLYFAQGYMHAYHRLWQMEFQVHFAAGRISEIVGPGALGLDRNSRRKGMVFGAEQFDQALRRSPEIAAYIDSYAAGINTYIESLSYADLPLEYKLLNYEPEQWTSLKTALLLKNMSNTLNVRERDLQNTNALKILGPVVFNLLFPDHLLKTDNIVDKEGQWNFDPILIEQDSGLIESVIQIEQVEPIPEEAIGSNNWVIAGERTKSGYPILASDPHLTLNLPSIWYTAHLNSPTVNTMGATLLGAPSVIIGFNDSIAWAETNAQRDLVDWYQIKFKDETRMQYMLDGQWTDVKLRIEEIKIKGQESYYDTVRYTYWGPVLYDHSFGPKQEKKDYAFKWIAHQESQEFIALMKLNRANNFAEYRDALSFWSAPAQNFAFASAQDGIGISVQGTYPIRPIGVGKFLLDGSVSANDWQAFIPYEHSIFEHNPERGFSSSANQYPADSTYPYYIHGRSYEVYRNRRINDLLSNSQNATPQDMMKIQQDNYNMTAAEGLPLLLGTLDKSSLSDSQQSLVSFLEEWDYYNNPDSKGASLFEIWFDAFYAMVWDEMLNSEVALPYPDEYKTIQLMETDPNFKYFDNLETPEVESFKDIAIKSFKEVTAEFDGIKDVKEWADQKNTYIQHLAQLPQFSTNVKNGGNHNIINATGSRAGPSWRMIVEMIPGSIKAWGVYPGGQSGNPGSPYYDDWVPVWERGDYHKLYFHSEYEKYQELTMHELTINPID